MLTYTTTRILLNDQRKSLLLLIGEYHQYQRSLRDYICDSKRFEEIIYTR